MTFSTGTYTDPMKVGAGEIKGDVHIILTSTDFEDGLQVGRFAQHVSGSPSLKNMDGTDSPVIVGVPKRHLGHSVEADATIDSTYQSHVEYVRWGLVTVNVKDGETPAKHGQVYVSNAGDADDGLATATDTDVAVNATFIHEVGNGAWVVLLGQTGGL